MYNYDAEILDNFTDEQEFRYVSRDADESEQGTRSDEKWWLPTVKVSPDGLSEESRQFLQKQKDSVNQVLKASMAINAQILADMGSRITTLNPSLRMVEQVGESIYKSITDELFDPLEFLSTMDLSSELKVLDLKNRIEASIVIWKRKMHHKDGKSSWGSAISFEKRELFEERAETILLLLQKFPGIPQSSLEISKIQYNKDVGLSILESYSRVLETLANTVMSRIQDVLYADSVAQNPSLAAATPKQSGDSMPSPTLSCYWSPGAEAEKLCSAAETPTSMKLSDFMGWKVGLSRAEIKKNQSYSNLESYAKSEEDDMMSKPPNITTKKFSFIDKIEMTV
ncbi:Rho guanine nucleotide exchange factor 8 [Sesamum angolense]|uniref:Rho guanine nucleotide exchange factor 8 n=1 Tax=Sesamum angolense TaxID=2727404 RepID=A0AAE2BTC8_9LAMI|nr:Rho guanine nucleotide exchange factor 8 [Sesamum angolense]